MDVLGKLQSLVGECEKGVSPSSGPFIRSLHRADEALPYEDDVSNVEYMKEAWLSDGTGDKSTGSINACIRRRVEVSCQDGGNGAERIVKVMEYDVCGSITVELAEALDFDNSLLEDAVDELADAMQDDVYINCSYDIEHEQLKATVYDRDLKSVELFSTSTCFGRIVIVVLWATWSKLSQTVWKETNEFVKVRWGDKVVVVGVCVDDESATWGQFLDSWVDRGREDRHFWCGPCRERTWFKTPIGKVFAVNQIPAVFAVNSQGMLTLSEIFLAESKDRLLEENWNEFSRDLECTVNSLIVNMPAPVDQEETPETFRSEAEQSGWLDKFLSKGDSVIIDEMWTSKGFSHSVIVKRMIEPTFKTAVFEMMMLDSWATFCEDCFKEKNNPPNADFFKSKVINDPKFSPEHILLQVTNSGDIASTLRFFVRRIRSRGGLCDYTVVGIGEVCTAKRFRGHGLSKLLFKQAFVKMDSMCVDMSSLHASLTLARGLYASQGYISVQTTYSILDIRVLENTSTLRSGISGLVKRVKQADLQEGNVLQTFASVYADSIPFTGTVAREMTYWNSWVLNAWFSPRRVQPQVITFGNSGAISAYVYVCKDNAPGTIRIGEIAWKQNEPSFDPRSVFILLVKSACSFAGATKVICPRPVLEELGIPEIDSVDDEGYMYKPVQQHDINGMRMGHTLWISDAF
mmetsp:Transcript_1415/g.1910  ORF Transcript_1415/g.1910 Transcript_1415/m.1910 type:complete len:689 (+) Transcript_1415:136-2202(+)